MRVKATFICLLTACFTLGPPCVVRADSAGEGAFLTDFAGSVSQVVAQMEGNRLVALRYAKHFRTDPSMVLAYFRQELSITTLEEETSVEVYHLDSSRNIVSETRTFKAGTKVFTNRAGTPVLQYGTGNPLAATLPTGGNVKRLAEAMNSNGENKVMTQVLEQPPMELKPTPTTAANTGSNTLAGTMTSGTVTASAPNTTGTVVASNIPGPASVPSIGKGRSFGSWLLPLGLAGAAAALGGGGGGSTSGLPPTNGGGDGGDVNPPPNIVPEPASLIALSSGLAGLCGVLARRRRYPSK